MSQTCKKKGLSDNDFNDFDFSSFEENPSWLVEDVGSMMEAKKTQYRAVEVSDKDPASKMAREIRHMKASLLPDKNDTYKHFGKEKKAASHPPDLSEVRRRKPELDPQSSSRRLDEAAVKEFMDIVQLQNKDKARRHEQYMKRSLYSPNPATLPGLPRRWSPTRPRTQVGRWVGPLHRRHSITTTLLPPCHSTLCSPLTSGSILMHTCCTLTHRRPDWKPRPPSPPPPSARCPRPRRSAPPPRPA
jgi:hypothetical protein